MPVALTSGGRSVNRFEGENAIANSYVTKARPSKPYPEFPLFAQNNR
jgi:hypothetical protein